MLSSGDFQDIRTKVIKVPGLGNSSILSNCQSQSVVLN